MGRVKERKISQIKERKENYSLELSNEEINKIREGIMSAICQAYYIPKEYFEKRR